MKTKFHVSSGLIFPNLENGTDWQRLVADKLAAMGSVKVTDGLLACTRGWKIV